MSSLEGGDFLCSRHNFRTDDIDSWNEHMGKEAHTDIVDTHCIECDTAFTVEMPFQPILPDGSKGISLRCDECEAKQGK